MIDNEGKFGIKIPKEVGIITCIFLLFINQIFAFIGGSIFFKTIFHVPVYIGTFFMALSYFIMIVFMINLD